MISWAMNSRRAQLLCCHRGFLMRLQSDIGRDCNHLEAQWAACSRRPAHVAGSGCWLFRKLSRAVIRRPFSSMAFSGEAAASARASLRES